MNKAVIRKNLSILQNAKTIIANLNSINLEFIPHSFSIVSLKGFEHSYAYKALVADLTDTTFGYPRSPTVKEEMILALAITQEDQNDYIREEQIEIANSILFADEELITYEDVQAYNSKYI